MGPALPGLTYKADGIGPIFGACPGTGQGKDPMSVFSSRSFDEHEQVLFCRDAATGLRAIIAVHSTALGPALGGCRFWDYGDEGAALEDVLRLSKGMTYKNAILCLLKVHTNQKREAFILNYTLFKL